MTGPLAAIRSAAPAAIAFAAIVLPIALIGGGWLPLGRVDPLLAVPGAGWAAVAAALASRRRGWQATLGGGLAGGLLVLVAALSLSTAARPWIALGLSVAAMALALAAARALAIAAHSIPHRKSWTRTMLSSLLLGCFAILWQQMAWQVIPLAYAASPGQRIRVTMLTSLPLEQAGADGIATMLSGDVDVAPSLLYLRQHFALRLVDQITPAEIAQTDVLLLAHPPALPPQSLVTIDDWIRAGGRAVVLADGLSSWPPAHPLGDPRNPPVTSLLTPLLSHWGVRLDAPPPTDSGVRQWHSGARRLHLLSVGRFVPENAGCSLSDDGIAGDCAIGAGRALLLADADLLHHELWQGTRPDHGASAWTSANMLWLHDTIDSLTNGEVPAPLAAPIWIES